MAITLETSLTIAAPIEKVWAALITPETVKEYFFGTELVTTWKIGSPIYFRGEWEGTAYEDKGIVLDFEEGKSLKYSYLSSWSNKLDLPENYNNITYSLEENGEETVLTITQDGFEDEEKRAHSEQNWQSIMCGMKELVERKYPITVVATIDAPIEKAWTFWTEPHLIVQWNNASEDWHTPHAENNLEVGGNFLFRMAAKDGSFSFDFTGIYTKIELDAVIEYEITGGRKVSILFEKLSEDTCKITEIFESENINSLELQQQGWQAILNNFKNYVEN